MHAIVEEKPAYSVRSLVVANLVAIALALLEGWNLREIMFIYWAQSVIIGYFSFRRMMDLKEFSTKGVRQNGRPVQPTERTKKSMAWFFVVHYGFFHSAYLFYLFSDDGQPFEGGWFLVVVCVAVFLYNHRFSYVEHRERDAERKPNIGTIMFFPYARIIPMHLMVTIGSAFGESSVVALVFFLGLKTLADVIMHKVEHTAWHNQLSSIGSD